MDETTSGSARAANLVAIQRIRNQANSNRRSQPRSAVPLPSPVNESTSSDGRRAASRAALERILGPSNSAAAVPRRPRHDSNVDNINETDSAVTVEEAVEAYHYDDAPIVSDDDWHDSAEQGDEIPEEGDSDTNDENQPADEIINGEENEVPGGSNTNVSEVENQDAEPQISLFNR